MEIKLPPHLIKSLPISTSEYCNRHTYTKNGTQHIKPIQKIIIDDKTVCPRCQLEKDDQALEASIQQDYDNMTMLQNYNIFRKESIVADRTIIRATFDNFEVYEEEETTNKNLTLDIVERLKCGHVFNPIIQGKRGTGKSHLTYAALNQINEYYKPLNKHFPRVSCLFINVEDMLRRIKDSFGNKESKYTESYFIDLLSKVDFLGLDDIGAETGAIDTDKQATNFVQRVLYAVSTTRQGRCTFITTNLSGENLFSMYDSKLVSRLLSNRRTVIFKDTKDKRMTNLGF